MIRETFEMRELKFDHGNCSQVVIARRRKDDLNQFIANGMVSVELSSNNWHGMDWWLWAKDGLSYRHREKLKIVFEMTFTESQ